MMDTANPDFNSCRRIPDAECHGEVELDATRNAR